MAALAAADTTAAAAAAAATAAAVCLYTGIVNLQTVTDYGSPLPLLCREVSRAVRIERRRLTSHSKVYAPSLSSLSSPIAALAAAAAAAAPTPPHCATRAIVYHWARHR